ncbi:MAG: monovalent cation/H(+) antiporter subunit G, partial [Candidatus Bathyarchaeota archaeon]
MIFLETIGLGILAIGLFCSIVGALGLLRLPDIFNRMHAATVCIIGGAVISIFGVTLTVEGLEPVFTVKALLTAGVIAFTSPVGSHAIVRAAYRSGVPLW